MADFAQSWSRGKRRESRISSSTPELLWRVLTAQRWELLKGVVRRRAGVDPRSGPPCE
jgi:hypothetical protein